MDSFRIGPGWRVLSGLLVGAVSCTPPSFTSGPGSTVGDPTAAHCGLPVLDDGWTSPPAPLPQTTSNPPDPCVAGAGVVNLFGPTAVASDPGFTNDSDGVNLPFSSPTAGQACLTTTIDSKQVVFARVELDGVVIFDQRQLLPGTSFQLPFSIQPGAHVINARFQSPKHGSLAVDVGFVGAAPAGVGPISDPDAPFALGALSDGPDPFSPANQDGHFDTTTLATTAYIRASATDNLQVQSTFLVVDPTRCAIVRTFSSTQTAPAGPGHVSLPLSATWDGRDSNGVFVPDGNYFYFVQAQLLKNGKVTALTQSILQTVQVDNTPPTLQVQSTPPGVMLPTQTALVAGRVTDKTLLASLSISISDGVHPVTTLPVTPAADGSFSVDVPLSFDPDATFTVNQITITAADIVVNTLSVQRAIVVAQKASPHELFVAYASGADPDAVNARIGATTERILRLAPRWRVVKVPNTVSLRQALTFFDAQVEVAGIFPLPVAIGSLNPHDPITQLVFQSPVDAANVTSRFNDSWDILAAKHISPYDPNGQPSLVRVAVLDSGSSDHHRDLVDNLDLSLSTLDRNASLLDRGLDYKRTPCLEDSNCQPHHSCEAASHTCLRNSDDNVGHGTACSGVIAAVGNNFLGVTGGAWSAQVVQIKETLLDTNFSWPLDTINAFEMADSIGSIKVINFSVGFLIDVDTDSFWGGILNALSKTIDPFPDIFDGLNGDGILVVKSAANDGKDVDHKILYPRANADSPNVITVAATDQNDQLASFSNYGAGTVQLAAPGTAGMFATTLPCNITTDPTKCDDFDGTDDMNSFRFTQKDGSYNDGLNGVFVPTNPDGTAYGDFQGTSASSPLTAACAVLIFAAHPDFTPYQVKTAIQLGVHPVPGLAPTIGADGTPTGGVEWGGRLDCAQALSSADTLFPATTAQQAAFRPSENDIKAIAWSPDGQLLALGTQGTDFTDSQFLIYDQAGLQSSNPQPVARFKYGDSDVNAVAWKSSTEIAVGTDEPALHLYGLANNQWNELGTVHSDDGVSAVGFGRDGTPLASQFFFGDHAGNIYNGAAAKLKVLSSEVNCLAVGNNFLAVGDDDNSAVIGTFVMQDFQWSRTSEMNDSPTACAVRPNTNQIVFGTDNNRVYFVDAVTGTFLTTFLQLTDQVTSVSWTPDGAFLAVSTQDDDFVGVYRLPPVITSGTTPARIFQLLPDRNPRAISLGPLINNQVQLAIGFESDGGEPNLVVDVLGF